MALVLGFMADAGPRLAGDSLSTTLLWSVALIAIGALLIFASSAIRRIGGRRGAPAALAVRGGH